MVSILEKKTVCSFCAEKNQRLELVLKGLLADLQCGSMFVSKDYASGKLTVLIAGETCDEFSCCCDCE